MSVDQEAEDKKSLLFSAYSRILSGPFREKYEDRWDEDAYWEAVSVFKAESLEIGYEDPCQVLGEFGLLNFEIIRAKLQAGPKPCFREGWKSPYTGEKVDILGLVRNLDHAEGPVFEGEERIVILDFWATWCEPCLMLAPVLSDIFEDHAGRVAVIGLVNDDMLKTKRKHDVEAIRTFLETHKESVRYPTYIDTDDHLARDSSFQKIEFLGLPSVALLVDNVVKFAGGAGTLKARLDVILKEIYPSEE